MLRVAPKGDVAAATPIALEEDRLLRSAFGRYGGKAAARAAAAPVVAHYQQLRGGQWFLCGCRPGAERPPALVPVSQTHIRRHEDTRWPVHCDTCDFYREPDEQRAVTASYGPPAVSKPLRLGRPLGGVAAAAPERSLEMRSHDTSRPGIARLLVQLTTDAGLQAIGPDWRPAPLIEQIKAIWAAARSIEIDTGVHLPEFLCTSPAKLGDLASRIEAAPIKRFTRTRPHGVLIMRVATIVSGMLQPVAGDPIPVRGRLSVFGEKAGDGRDSRAERSARAPYLAACVVGRALDGEPVEILSAYVHPCVSETHLMLVDSDMERRTLDQLRSVQSWLGGKRHLPVTIEKPMFDIGPATQIPAEPRPPCIPDFVLRASRPGDAGKTVIAETMGFAAEDYRIRKGRIHPLMSAALGGAPVIEHDFHQPVDAVQDRRDTAFWQAIRWALSGPEAPDTSTLRRQGRPGRASSTPLRSVSAS